MRRDLCDSVFHTKAEAEEFLAKVAARLAEGRRHPGEMLVQHDRGRASANGAACSCGACASGTADRLVESCAGQLVWVRTPRGLSCGSCAVRSGITVMSSDAVDEKSIFELRPPAAIVNDQRHP